MKYSASPKEELLDLTTDFQKIQGKEELFYYKNATNKIYNVGKSAGNKREHVPQIKRKTLNKQVEA